MRFAVVVMTAFLPVLLPIIATICLPVLAPILLFVSLPILTSVLLLVGLMILASIRLPVLATILLPISLPVLAAVFATHIVRLHLRTAEAAMRPTETTSTWPTMSPMSMLCPGWCCHHHCCREC